MTEKNILRQKLTYLPLCVYILSISHFEHHSKQFQIFSFSSAQLAFFDLTFAPRKAPLKKSLTTEAIRCNIMTTVIDLGHQNDLYHPNTDFGGTQYVYF